MRQFNNYKYHADHDRSADINEYDYTSDGTTPVFWFDDDGTLVAYDNDADAHLYGEQLDLAARDLYRAACKLAESRGLLVVTNDRPELRQLDEQRDERSDLDELRCEFVDQLARVNAGSRLADKLFGGAAQRLVAALDGAE